MKEEELKMQKEAQLQEIQETREAIIEERKWLESVREDVDINFSKNKQPQQQPKPKPKKSKTISDMPR